MTGTDRDSGSTSDRRSRVLSYFVTEGRLILRRVIGTVVATLIVAGLLAWLGFASFGESDPSIEPNETDAAGTAEVLDATDSGDPSDAETRSNATTTVPAESEPSFSEGEGAAPTATHVEVEDSTEYDEKDEVDELEGGSLEARSDIVVPRLWPSWNGETWVVLSWLPENEEGEDASADAGTPDNFEIRYRLNRDSDWSTSPSSKTSYHDGSRVDVYEYYHRIENLIRLEDYVAQVRECADDQCSEWASHSFRTEKPVPPAPDEVRVVDVGTDFFILEWDPVPGAYNYDVNYRGGGSITAGGSNSTRYETVFELTPGSRYTITVNSCNDLQRHGDYGEEACGLLSAGTTITVTTLELTAAA